MRQTGWSAKIASPANGSAADTTAPLSRNAIDALASHLESEGARKGVNAQIHDPLSQLSQHNRRQQPN
jgi:hypothetical protein